jgi:hypothetical protein
VRITIDFYGSNRVVEWPRIVVVILESGVIPNSNPVRLGQSNRLFEFETPSSQYATNPETKFLPVKRSPENRARLYPVMPTAESVPAESAPSAPL